MIDERHIGQRFEQHHVIEVLATSGAPAPRTRIRMNGEHDIDVGARAQLGDAVQIASKGRAEAFAPVRGDQDEGFSRADETLQALGRERGRTWARQAGSVFRAFAHQEQGINARYCR